MYGIKIKPAWTRASLISLSLLVPHLQNPAAAATSPLHPFIVLGYIHSKGKPDLDPVFSWLRNSHLLTHLSPCWLTLEDSNGTLTGALDEDLVAACSEADVKILPRLSQKGFSRSIVHAFLRNPSARRRMAAHLRDWLIAHRCHGVNLDFEYVPAEDRLQLSTFAAELQAALKPSGLMLTMAVPAKAADNPQSDWSGAFDFPALGRCCDLIVLMAYDEHYATSRPGPIASMPFVEKVLSYAQKTIAPSKILLGLPFYARDWPEHGRGKSWSGKELRALVQKTGAEVQWDTRAKSPWLEYVAEGGKRTIWFEDMRSIAAKVCAAQQSHLAGLSLWRLGGEDPSYWLPIAHYKAGGGWKGWLAAIATAIRNSSSP